MVTFPKHVVEDRNLLKTQLNIVSHRHGIKFTDDIVKDADRLARHLNIVARAIGAEVKFSKEIVQDTLKFREQLNKSFSKE